MDARELTKEPRVSMIQNSDISLIQLMEKNTQGNVCSGVSGLYHVVYSSVVAGKVERGLQSVPDV